MKKKKNIIRKMPFSMSSMKSQANTKVSSQISENSTLSGGDMELGVSSLSEAAGGRKKGIGGSPEPNEQDD